MHHVARVVCSWLLLLVLCRLLICRTHQRLYLIHNVLCFMWLSCFCALFFACVTVRHKLHVWDCVCCRLLRKKASRGTQFPCHPVGSEYRLTSLYQASPFFACTKSGKCSGKGCFCVITVACACMGCCQVYASCLLSKQRGFCTVGSSKSGEEASTCVSACMHSMCLAQASVCLSAGLHHWLPKAASGRVHSCCVAAACSGDIFRAHFVLVPF